MLVLETCLRGVTPRQNVECLRYLNDLDKTIQIPLKRKLYINPIFINKWRESHESFFGLVG